MSTLLSCTTRSIKMCDTFSAVRRSYRQAKRLLLLLLVGLVDLEVSERVGVLGGGDDSEEVLEVVLLQVLLREVLAVRSAMTQL